jgi:6-pyruvoyltetrahydropterin/6-carboxytetrahydropterin synthase
MKVCRRETFNAAHRLFRPDWSDQKNDEVFGKCNNPNFHGHNYVLETWVEGEVDSDTGFLIDLKILKEMIQKEVTEKFDHKNLNLDCKEFQNIIPTAENMSIVFWNILREKLDRRYKLTVKLWETENNICEYSGE